MKKVNFWKVGQWFTTWTPQWKDMENFNKHCRNHRPKQSLCENTPTQLSFSILPWVHCSLRSRTTGVAEPTANGDHTRFSDDPSSIYLLWSQCPVCHISGQQALRSGSITFSLVQGPVCWLKDNALDPRQPYVKGTPHEHHRSFWETTGSKGREQRPLVPVPQARPVLHIHL